MQLKCLSITDSHQTTLQKGVKNYADNILNTKYRSVNQYSSVL